MDRLPPELILVIAEVLPPNTLSILSRTCQSYHHLLAPLLNDYFKRHVIDIREYAIRQNNGPLLSRTLASPGYCQPTSANMSQAVQAGAGEALRVLLDCGTPKPCVITLSCARYLARRNGGRKGSKEVLEFLLASGLCAVKWRVGGIELHEWEKSVVLQYGSGEVDDDGCMMVGTRRDTQPQPAS